MNLNISIEAHLEQLLRKPNLGTLKECVGYAVLGGGKRLRPRLLNSIVIDLGGECGDVLAAGLAIELLHCSSLVHDDLPALDNDWERRGMPSAHAKFGEATAILAGDALIALAFEALSFAPVEILNQQVKIIANGFQALCAGQQLDLVGAEDLSELKRIHELKTGALFSAIGDIAFTSPQTDKALYDCVQEFLKTLGLFYQVRDDYLDQFGEKRALGKAAGSDAANHRKTFAYFYSKDALESEIKALEKRLCELLGAIPKGETAAVIAPFLTLPTF